jgi:hypothetical protein
MPATIARTLFSSYAPVALNDASVPPFPGHEADEEEEGRGLDVNLDLEVAQASWRGIGPATAPPDVPVRFIDGSIKSKTVGCIIVGARRRPLIAAAVSAAAIEIEGRATKRGAGAVTKKVLAVHSNGIERDDWLEAFHALGEIGVELRSSEAEAAPQAGDFDTLRRTTRGIAMLAMEEAERDVMLAGLPAPTLMDGLLERRLATQKLDWPVIGLVKRQMTSYLPSALQEIVYGLRPGERTPAFVMDTLQHVELVNFYMRLSSEKGASPSYGIVRVTVPWAYAMKAHASDLPEYLSGLAGYLYALRMRDQGYSRSGISVEPIVRCEDHLHAILPSLDALIPKLHRRLVTGG